MTSSFKLRAAVVRLHFVAGAIGVLTSASCAHTPEVRPEAPRYTAAQERARAGRWGGPEVNLTADAMAYAAGHAAEVAAWKDKLGHTPLVRVCPLDDATDEGANKADFVRSLSQALSNGGHFEVAADAAPGASVEGFVRSRLSSEPMQIEGQRAMLYTLSVILEDAKKEPLWQRREIIRKWAAPSEAQSAPPHVLPPQEGP